MKKHYKKIVFEHLPFAVQEVINDILEKEGERFVDHENDWPTKWGIRQLSADRAGYTGAIRDIDRNTAARIWTSLFWYGPNINAIHAVSPLIAETVLDTAGPAGVRRGIKHLQEALTSYNAIHKGKRIYGEDLALDGVIGKQSLKQLQLYLQHRKNSDGERKLATRLNCLQDAHFCNLAIRVPKKRSFSFGWNSHRVFADLMNLANETDEMMFI